MKWFKHLTGSLKDSFVFESIEKFGADAYLVFFGTLELMADEFDINRPGINRLSIKKLTAMLQLSRQKTVRILQHFNQVAEKNTEKNVSFFVSFENDHIIVTCNKLKDLCDEFTQKQLKKIGSQSGVNRESIGHKEVEVEEDIHIKEEPKKKIQKEKWGEFQNVFLSVEEREKLIKLFGEDSTNQKIENLSIGIQSKGYKYKSHYATILSWDRKEKRENRPQIRNVREAMIVQQDRDAKFLLEIENAHNNGHSSTGSVEIQRTFSRSGKNT